MIDYRIDRVGRADVEARLQVRRWRCQRVHRVDLRPGIISGEATAHGSNICCATEFAVGILRLRRMTVSPEYSGSGGALICANNASRRASLSVVMMCSSVGQYRQRLLVQIKESPRASRFLSDQSLVVETSLDVPVYARAASLVNGAQPVSIQRD